MLNEILKTWNGTVTINGTEVSRTADIASLIDFNAPLDILLSPKEKSLKTAPSVSKRDADYAHTVSADVNDCTVGESYKISVKAYMTKKSDSSFDFMRKWNNDNPMPLRVMTGTVIKQTRGMIYMQLHGDLYSKTTHRCMKCGRPITNPISQYFGLGPECGGHNYVNPFSSDEELADAVNSYRQKLRETIWEGWIIKSAIEEIELIRDK